MKKLFLVRGSEDGNLGIYSNKQKAFEAMLDYLVGDETYFTENDLYVLSDDKKVKAVVRNFNKELNEYFLVTVYRLDEVSVSVECFYLNN